MNKKYNITYCSNIFKNNKLIDLIKNLKEYKKKNKEQKNISICLSNNILKEIKKNNNIKKIYTWIKINKLNIKLINGFVYKQFHTKKIKEFIYYPDWTKIERYNFTKNILYFIQKINKFKNFGVTTLPISYEAWIKKEKKYNLKKSINNLFKILEIIIKIKKYKKRNIHLDIEPEPFCSIEKCNDFIIFFNTWLIPLIKKNFKLKYKIKEKKYIKYIRKHINICYDACHSAVMFENQKKNLDLIKKEKIKIGRIQISSAIKIKFIEKNKINLDFLKKSSFLHQSIIKLKNNKIIKKKDFFELKNIKDLIIKEIRIHCHIPIYEKKISKNIYTTQNELILLIKNMIKNKDIKNLEIETYTYDTMYKKSCKIESIKKEYNWLIANLKKNI